MEERSQSEGFYEMLWDCDHCGQKGLLGKSQRHCPACGAPQNPDKRYFPSPEQQTKIEGHEYVGADRHCPACNAPMSAKANNCTQCGSPLDGGKDVRGVQEKPAPPPKKKRRIWPWILGVIAVFVAIGWYCTRTTSVQVTVAAHRWQTAIAIEEFGDHEESAWRDQVPAGASLPICHRAQRSSRQVEDGEECHTERHDKKDGTFEQIKKCKPKYRSEPIMDDMCSFTVRRWAKVDEAKASGTGTDLQWPTSPTLPPPAAPAPTMGARRQGARSQALTLDFGSAGSCDVGDAIWRTYKDGQKVQMDVRARSGEVVCSHL